MSKNITPSPCNNCKRKQCIGLCSDYKIWFSAEWQRVTKLFRELKEKRDTRKENIKTLFDNNSEEI